jgi:Holliday junction resolvasome RuvABC endonuclease subunit
VTAYIGVDPGQSGALALVGANGVLIATAPMPVIDKEVIPLLLVELLNDWRKDTQDRTVVVIEKVHSMPGQGVATSFKFGKNYGIAIGAVQGVGFPMHYLTPQQWKKMFSLIGKDKDASRGIATDLWPSMKHNWARKSDNGVSDAALIAEAARRQGL